MSTLIGRTLPISGIMAKIMKSSLTATRTIGPRLEITYGTSNIMTPIGVKGRITLTIVAKTA